ncbi:MAG: isochorismatase family protein [Gammaproteobacteria bacterium]|jgi:nicotinamidase-related amidase
MSSAAALCRCQDSVLVMVDIQERLARAMPAEDLEAFLHSGSILLRAAAELDVPVLATEQYPEGLGETLPQLRQHYPEAAGCMTKTGFSCCAAEGFTATLKTLGRSQVILAGVESHVCVLQTALELKALGFTAFVVADAVCARSRSRTDNALSRLRQSGVIVTHSESVLFEWLGDARHPRFKAVSQLLKGAGS